MLTITRRTRSRSREACSFGSKAFYNCKELSLYKGQAVEVRYSDDDYTEVWVVLPDGSICRASRVTPTSILTPNKETLREVARYKAHERKVISEYALIAESAARGEGIEERAARAINQAEDRDKVTSEPSAPRASVTRITRMDKAKLEPTPAPVPQPAIRADYGIFDIPMTLEVTEGYGDD